MTEKRKDDYEEPNEYDNSYESEDDDLDPEWVEHAEESDEEAINLAGPGDEDDDEDLDPEWVEKGRD